LSQWLDLPKLSERFMVKVCSFDVYDTCLTRRVAVPSDVFYAVAEKIFSTKGIVSSHPFLEDFVAARMQAEHVARQQMDREDVTLDEIWRNLIRSMGWQPDESLAKCELEVEEELLVPVSSICKQVQTARQQGVRIVFVSDMYLPREFIEQQLVKHGFAEPGDGIYVSSEVGKTKASGNLFRHLLVQENVPASKVLHIGDNPHSDYAVPRELNIRARLFSDAKLTQAEMSVLQTDQASRAPTAIAGAMRAFRLRCGTEDDQDINELTSQFIAPFVMGFATWVLQRAQEDGVRRLYFMSRDCQLVWKVARKLAPQFGGIECRYLFVSRQALFLPSANAICPEEMPWMRRSFEDPALKNLLGKIELKFVDVQPVLGELTGNEGEQFRLKSEKDWRQFWDALNEESVKTHINKLIGRRREAARQYFESAGLFDEVSWAVVDLGWYVTGQQSLWKMLKTWGWQKQIRGIYLALKLKRVGFVLAGEAEALIYEYASRVPKEFEKCDFFSRQTLLEHIIGCADHPTVHHYEETGEGKAIPAFVGSVNKANLNFCKKLHDGVLDFVAQNQTLVGDYKDTALCRETLATLATNFFKCPTPKSARALVGLEIATDQNGLDAQPIVKSLGIGKALLPLLPRRGPLKYLWRNSDCPWQEAAMAVTPQAIQRIAIIVQHVANLRARARRALIG
jgi:predicted HAD superfamily hydrolase